MNKKLVRKLLRPLSYINRLIPKRDNCIVIYSNLGFRDNVRAVYDYLILNGYNNKYKIICSIDDTAEYKHIKIKNVKFIDNYAGIFYYLTSKYYFYCFGKYPIKPSSKQMVINLWHGMPLKKIGNLEPETQKEDYNYFSYVIATSPFFSKIMQKAFNCEEEQILISGQPRNDELFIKDSLKMDLELQRFKKVIMWLPTFRKSSRLDLIDQLSNMTTELSFPLVDSKTKMRELNQLLNENESVIIIKPHPMQDLTDNDLQQYSNIIIKKQQDLADSNITLYNLLKEADALITDYSSVYFDYLLLDRPIGFTVDDLSDYKKARGFVVEEPYEIMPGAKIENFDSFKTFIESVLKNEDVFSLQRKKINTLCNTYNDGKSCEKILEFCGIKLG